MVAAWGDRGLLGPVQGWETDGLVLRNLWGYAGAGLAGGRGSVCPGVGVGGCWDLSQLAEQFCPGI